MKYKILVNASNLHTGGGVQVAVSFIHELVNNIRMSSDIEVWVSEEVARNITGLGLDLSKFPMIKIKSVFGLRAVFSKLNCKLSRFDLVFTVFGPNYFLNRNYVDLVGFAQPWIIDGSAYQLLSSRGRLAYKLKFSIQKLFFKLSDALVVELGHVKDGVVREGIVKSDRVYVVHNCISSLYFDRESWEDLSVCIDSSRFKIGFLGRDYTHKNTAVLPDVKRVLLDKYGLAVDFYVTFSEAEWVKKAEEFRAAVNNVGSLTVAQCPKFYEAMDAIIFPSILECFSATPLEAMVMEKPLFASDKGFVRNVCGDFAFYFDPLDIESIAGVIACYISSLNSDEAERLVSAKKHAANFSNANNRAKYYLDIIADLVDDPACEKCKL